MPASAPRATPRAALPPAPPATPHARGRWRVRTAIVGAWAAYGAANVLLYEASGTAPGTSLGWSVPVMLAVATFWVAATPVVGSITRRLARPGVGRARRVAFHAVAALALALASIAVRWLVLGLVGDFARPVTFATLVSRTLDVHLCMYALLAALTSASEADRDYVARTRRALALEGQLARARLDHLQRQLQPHFLFNALNAVAELTREAPEQAARMLRQLARLFRAATGHLAGAEVPLADELAVLDAYVDVQRTRTGGGLRVTYAVDPAARDALVPPFVLQPLVENAIRHGLAARAGRGRVAVTAAAAGGRLLLRVADDGVEPPAPARAATGRRGIGLANTAARLAQLYGAAHRLDVRVDPAGGTTVALDLPLRLAPPAAARAPGGPAPGGAPPTAAAPNGEPPNGEPPDGALPGGAPPGGAPPGEADLVVELVAPERHLRPPRGLLAWARGGRRGAGGPTPAADAAPAPDVELPLRGAGRTAALWTAVTLCWTLQVLVGEYADGGAAAVRATWRRDLVLQASVAVPWALLTPVVLRFARAVRVTRDRWAVPLAVHLAVAAALAPAELAVALAALGWKAPFLTAGTVNPLSLNVLIYVSLVAWVHARLFAAWYRERATAADRLAADLERTRLRTLAVEMNPDFVTALLEGCAALAPARPAAAERLVERTAELLRAMLDAARARVPTLRAELALLRESLALLEAVTGRPARLHLDAPAAWAGAGVAGGGLRHALGLAALRAGAGGVDVVVAPAAPAPPERGAPRTGRAPLGRLAAWVAPRAADGSPADESSAGGSPADGSPADERACVAGTAGGAAAYAPTFAAAAAPAAAVAPGLPTPVLP